jgi:valyl-tRNA synthetase
VDGRNFCNKLWNIARFTEGKLGEGYRKTTPEPKTIADHWIISELNSAIAEIEHRVESYKFAEARESMYHVIWDSVADWYVEASKSQDNKPMLAWVLDTCLRLAHPFAPFVTETIWQTLSWHSSLLIKTKWPAAIECDDIAAAEFGRLKHLVTEARFVISGLPGDVKYSLLYQNDSLIADNTELIKRLAKLKDVTEVDTPRGMRLANSGREAWLDISAKTLEKHKTNLQTRLSEANELIKTLEQRLGNKSYVEKAPSALVEESRMLMEQKKALVERLEHELEIIN